MTTPRIARNQVDQAKSASGRRVRRVLAGASVSALALTANAGVASAATSHVDVFHFTAHVFVTNPKGPTSSFLLVSDSCTVSTDGAAPAPCSVVAPGSLNVTGGTARAVLRAGNHTDLIKEAFVFTGPTTSTGVGTATVFGSTGVSAGTFVGNFTAVPTANPHVLLDQGAIIVKY